MEQKAQDQSEVTPALWVDRKTLTCPHCGHVAQKGNFLSLDTNEIYEEVLVPIRKCPNCSHLFAPLPFGIRLVAGGPEPVKA